MPAVAATNLERLVDLAGRWLEVPRPAALPRDLCLSNRSARAAFSLASFSGGAHLEACLTCGTWTASWCEGCYAREERLGHSIEFSALCTSCDQEHRVCPLCADHGITWAEGNRSAIKTHGEPEETEITITGFWTDDGQFIQSDEHIAASPSADGASASSPRP